MGYLPKASSLYCDILVPIDSEGQLGLKMSSELKLLPHK